jgi:hypothetical protein
MAHFTRCATLQPLREKNLSADFHFTQLDLRTNAYRYEDRAKNKRSRTVRSKRVDRFLQTACKAIHSGQQMAML